MAEEMTKDTAEFRGSTFIVHGVPMSHAEYKAYLEEMDREKKEQRDSLSALIGADMEEQARGTPPSAARK